MDDEVRQKGGAPAEGAKNQPTRLMKNPFFVILILPLALLNEESQKTCQTKGVPRPEGLKAFFRKRNAFFRITDFLFRRGDNCFPSPFSPLRASPFSENSVYPMRVYYNNNLSYALSP